MSALKNTENTNPACKSIFKNGENTVTKSRFTKMWIDMINLTEKSKSGKS